MCIGEDAIKVWIRGLLASFNASAALSISLKLALARPVMAGPFIFSAIVLTALKSPCEAMGNPASITSTEAFPIVLLSPIFHMCSMKLREFVPHPSRLYQIYLFSLTFIYTSIHLS
jgi:hypothetical protein